MTPKEELQELVDAFLPHAQQLLAENGEFYPFGGAINSKGEIISVAAYDGDEHPASQTLIDLLVQSFKAEAKQGTYRATAIVYDVRVVPPDTEEKSDAICLDLDHVEGLSLTALLPYSFNGDGEIVYTKLFAQAGGNKIFN
jgi:hypothetical protein